MSAMLSDSAAAPLADLGGPLVDRFGRVHASLRVSVTDRCNLRCRYCMPLENVRFKPRDELLSFEEIADFVRALVPLGVVKVRLTGGEPLVRAELPALVAMLSSIDGLRDLALTTNGLLLAEQAAELRAAGLHRINVSLDALTEEAFELMARRRGLPQVLAGIDAALAAGFDDVRLNAVAVGGVNEDQLVPLAKFARARGLELRFIEFMPLDADQTWAEARVLAGADVRRMLHQEFGPLRPARRLDPSKPSVDYVYADGGGRVGFINPVSDAFCGTCDRLRLTADGQVRNCLFSTAERDVRSLLRAGAPAAQIQRLVREAVASKAAAHGIGEAGFQRPERAMYQIGG